MTAHRKQISTKFEDVFIYPYPEINFNQSKKIRDAAYLVVSKQIIDQIIKQVAKER